MISAECGWASALQPFTRLGDQRSRLLCESDHARIFHCRVKK